MNSLRLLLAVAATICTTAFYCHGQTAKASISGVADGASYDYTVKLTNTGSFTLNSFWYGWTTGGNNLPATPSNAGNSVSWGNTVSGNSIKWVNSSGTALAPGASASFTFTSASSPTAITTSPSGESVAYVSGIDFTQAKSGDSTPVFSPVLVSNAAPVFPTAAATISGVPDGGAYDYTVTLTNTGTLALNSFWYGWTTGGNNLPAVPSNAGNSVSWGNTVSGNSIKWVNSSGTALAPGASATFTFTSASSPTAITTSPSGESVAYVNGIDFTQDTAEDSTAVFSPALVAAPVFPTADATIYGAADGGLYDYTVTLTNTGTLDLNSFWYGWTTDGNNLPGVPSAAGNSAGWDNSVTGNSIEWVNNSGTALAPGASATFTFTITSSPTAVTTSPSGESVAYVGGIDFSQDTAEDSTAVFSPALVAAPVFPTAAAIISGVPDGGAYDYTMTLTNTGTLALNSFWYGWTTDGNNLPAIPSTAGNSIGWDNSVTGNSIEWVNNSGTALAPGASATFTFTITSSPTAVTTSPSGESVAYVGGIDFSQDTAEDSTAVFSPALVSASSPISMPVLAATVTTSSSGGGTPTGIVLAWPATNSGLTLQATVNLMGSTGWSNVSVTPSVVNGQNVVTNAISGAHQFFRLVTTP